MFFQPVCGRRFCTASKYFVLTFERGSESQNLWCIQEYITLEIKNAATFATLTKLIKQAHVTAPF